MKTKWSGTVAAEFARHCLETRGETEEQVQARIERLWDRLGRQGRFRYFCRVNNILVHRRLAARKAVA